MCPLPNDGTSFYRGYGVLNYLKDVKIKPITINRLNTINWSDLAGVDILFIQRPHTDIALNMISVAKQLNIPVWVDIDDMTWEVPTSSDRSMYFEKCTVALMATIVKNATVTTVATQYLKDSLDIYGNVIVVPNAFNDYIFNFTPSIKRNPSIIWRGSSTHAHDVSYFSEEIDRLSTRFNNEFTFVGLNPENYLKTSRISLVRTLELLDYFNYLRFQNQDNICMIPLKPIKFNYAKSNIGWIEATLSNKIAVVPIWKEWQRPGVLNYKDKDSFLTMLTHLMNNNIDIETEIKNSKEYITDNLLLSNVNKLRTEIVKNI